MALSNMANTEIVNQYNLKLMKETNYRQQFESRKKNQK